MIHLVQLLLPLRDPSDEPFPRSALDRVRDELTERFGGATAYLRAPAQGAWKDDDQGGRVERDEIVIVEVMADSLDRDWWRQYREELRQRFRQEELVVRATQWERL